MPPRKAARGESGAAARRRRRAAPSAAAAAAAAPRRKPRAVCKPPELRGGGGLAELLSLYGPAQVCLVRARGAPQGAAAFRRLRAVQGDHPAMVARTFSIESPGGAPQAAQRSRAPAPPTTPDALFRSATPLSGRWYASFIVQGEKAALQSVLRWVPHPVPPCLCGSAPQQSGERKRRRGAAAAEAPPQVARHSECVWFFLGRNTAAECMPGRPEHTDDVTHCGTWHLQLQGAKTWHLRPTEELLQRNPSLSPCTVTCRPGDVLVVNTRLWWHRTELPDTRGAAEGLSVSYARDFRLVDAQPGGGDADDDDESADMTNVEGLYAPQVVPAGSVVATADDMPDCSLPRSKEPNCVVTDTKVGRRTVMALVALREIAAGEWFSVAPSDDEGGEEDEEGEEDESEAAPEPPPKRRR
eukprot:TRINITY_DN62093_c0_g1_i1.p2 TRINITY_DN62093_c0_g1~~TRINITY_DN62093_c0_g1_i1.p2  ORF type:complete len:413 (+),score=112.98 TRINITY_DN62093_c0_g1_i1:67-1305(+)